MHDGRLNPNLSATDPSLRSGLSVVVPTYNAKRLLAGTLDSLCQQDIDTDSFEVIVVDDGSSDGTAQLVQTYADRINITYHFQENQGFRAAAARNVGIRAAKFDITLFLDSGIVVSSRLLRLHWRGHQASVGVAILGLSYGVREYDNPKSDAIGNTLSLDADDALRKLSTYPAVQDCRVRYLESIDYDLSGMSSPWLIFWSGHVSAKTALLREVGGFDEWFRCWGGEDVELGLRLFQAGCDLTVLRTTESIHYPHLKNPEEKRRDSGTNVAYIHKKHGLRETALLKSYGWESIVRGEVEINVEDKS